MLFNHANARIFTVVTDSMALISNRAIQQIKDDNQIEEAIKLTTDEMALSSGFCNKEELKKVIKKR